MSTDQPQRQPLIARGSWQQELWAELLKGQTVRPQRYLVGKAGMYTDKYMDSFANMLKRATLRGYRFKRTPGAKGGEWSASYRLVGRPDNADDF